MTDNNTLQNSDSEYRNLLNGIKTVIESGRREAYASINQTAVITYWKIGQKIVEEEQNGQDRAAYGKQLIKMLATELSREYGSAFSKRNLEFYRQFYLSFRDFEIVNARVHNLTWTHFRRLLSVANPEARMWYLKEASEEMWSSRTLDRNIGTQYYERLLVNQRANVTLPLPEKEISDPREYIKNPVVAEFLGFRKDTKFDETQLEQALIDNLRQFVMELGRGFAFVDRQKHIHTDAGDFYIDLVFYNINLHCYVLFDLKTRQITHQDVGQMDMYVRMYDDLIKLPEDNPTIGILLCSETSRDIARYSVLHGNEQLFASKYMPFLPTQEELRFEIEQQKRFFLEQHPESGND